MRGWRSGTARSRESQTRKRARENESELWLLTAAEIERRAGECGVTVLRLDGCRTADEGDAESTPCAFSCQCADAECDEVLELSVAVFLHATGADAEPVLANGHAA